MADLNVVLCDAKAARYACEHWHYSKTLPPGRKVHYGAWEQGAFIGAVVFGRGANKNMLKPYGLTMTEGCELVRVALTSHDAPVSQVVALALRRLAADNPGLRLVVSYADPQQGHVGGIYKAGNWIYTGRASGSSAFRTRDGRVLHQREVSDTGYGVMYDSIVRMPKRSECERITLPGKHRYLYPLDRAMRRRVAKLAQPYPSSE